MKRNCRYKIWILNPLKNKKDKKLFKSYKAFIFNYAKKIIDNNFDFYAKVNIVPKKDTKKTDNIEVEDGFTVYEKKNDEFFIYINFDAIQNAKETEGANIMRILYHELAHVLDLHHIIHNKYHQLDLGISKQNNFYDHYLVIGTRFWTEIFAYSQTFNMSKEYFPSKYQLIQVVKKLEKMRNILRREDGLEPNNAFFVKLDEYASKLNDLVYYFSKHVVGNLFYGQKKNRYCEKTLNSKYYAYIDKTAAELTKKVIPIFNNTYGKGMPNKLVALGKYIAKNIYKKFDCSFVMYEGYVNKSYCFKKPSIF